MKSSSHHSWLFQRVHQLQWQAPLLALLLVFVHQVIEHTWLAHLPRWEHFATQMLFYGLVGPTLAWLALSSLKENILKTERTQQALEAALISLEQANQRMEFLVQANRKLAEAEDEEALLESVLTLAIDAVDAAGCSLILFDEHARPLPPIHRGELTPEEFAAWSRHIASAAVKEVCAHCSAHWAVDSQTCPLLNENTAAASFRKVVCLDLARGNRLYGIINIYLDDPERPTETEHILLTSLAKEISLALESQHYRARELNTLFRLQKARKLYDLHTELADMLAHLVSAMNINGGLIFLADGEQGKLELQASAGADLGPRAALVQGLANSAFQTKTPFVISDLTLDSEDTEVLRSLLIAPMWSDEELLGCVALWSSDTQAFTRRQAQLVETVAAQSALLIENHRLYTQVEHQAALAERNRLAREIHDGLAQTLGYLQLRMGQINHWIAAGEEDRVFAAIEEIDTLINEAYNDVREAIDGLRFKTEGTTIKKWLGQILTHFHQSTGIPVETTPPPELPLTPDCQVQLLRIIQEGLGNIRKHSGAERAWLEWQQTADWLVLRICDDGNGFKPESIASTDQHGLKIMRERAELMDADFQIISAPANGTIIEIRLPISAKILNNGNS